MYYHLPNHISIHKTADASQIVTKFYHVVDSLPVDEEEEVHFNLLHPDRLPFSTTDPQYSQR